MKVTINHDGRTNIQCPNCKKIFHPHIIFPKKKKVVGCNFCNHRFIVQAQKRNNILVWVRTKYKQPNINKVNANLGNPIGNCPRCGCFLGAKRINGDIEYFKCSNCGFEI